jgi:hypothetical protein
MTRNQTIELILRQIYNGQPSDDSSITFNQVNLWLNQAIAAAAKKNYADNIQVEGVSFVNNSFYTSFKNLAVAVDDFCLYKITLPQIPVSLGKNEGVSTLQFVDSKGKVSSHSAVPLSENQLAYQEFLRPIQNKLLYWSEGLYLYVKTTIPLHQYTARVRMVSGGDSNDLNSVLTIPDDAMPMVIEYVKQQLAFERSRPIDTSNDGVDSVN